MKARKLIGLMTSAIMFLFVSIVYAQGSDVYWHIDPHVKSCSMVIDTALTQSQWHRFANQASAIVTFKSLASAKTLGKMKFSFAIDDAYTPVDQHDLSWINTFTHPDEDCPLGDAITFPALRARMGVSDKMDIGAFWTTTPQANYGVTGGEFKYAFMQESKRYPAAAVRGSFSILTGVPDFNVNIYSIELIGSKKISVVSPYVGIRENVIIASETTSKVDLRTERIALTQGYVGIAYSVWKINLATEYDISSVNTLAFAVGFGI